MTGYLSHCYVYFISGADLQPLRFWQTNKQVGWRENQMVHAVPLWVLHVLAGDSQSLLLFSTCLSSASGDSLPFFMLQFFLFRMEASCYFFWVLSCLRRRKTNKQTSTKTTTKHNVHSSVKVYHADVGCGCFKLCALLKSENCRDAVKTVFLCWREL